MPRTLDLTALRAFVTVAETGGVTRASGQLNLTQSAVSMQLKRLEDAVGVGLMDRTHRRIGLTPAGEQLLGYGRRMLALNDEALGRLTAEEYEGELRLGVPHDVIYPAIPPVLRQFATAYPRLRIKLISAPTRDLKEMFDRGEAEAILTTEDHLDAGGETLTELALAWIGAKSGAAWRQAPLPIAFCSACIFRAGVLRKLDEAGTDWHMAVESEMDNAVEAAVSADLAVTAALASSAIPQTAMIEHGGALPDLGQWKINLYARSWGGGVVSDLKAMLRNSYRTV